MCVTGREDREVKVPAGMSVDALLETLYALFGTAVNAAYQDEEVSMRAHTHTSTQTIRPHGSGS